MGQSPRASLVRGSARPLRASAGAEVHPGFGKRIESGGRSRAGATGLWQFMYRTARYFDLEINSWVDERRDPVASTDAACRYLKQLNEMYDGDWHLALAAYNGSREREQGHSPCRNPGFLESAAIPPREPRYVPSSWPWRISLPTRSSRASCPVTGSAVVQDGHGDVTRMRFDQVAHVTGRSVAELTQLNPQYRKEVVPGAIGGGWPLVLPREVVGVFIERMPEAFSWEPEQTPEVTLSLRSLSIVSNRAMCWAASRNDLGFRSG